MDRIFYFSSTGNSLYIAKRIALRLGSVPEYIPKTSERSIEADRVVVVSPVYSFGLPTQVFDFLSELRSDAPLYVVLNYGGVACGADRLTYDLCAERGLNIRAVFKLKMVENYTLSFTVPKLYQKMTLKKAPSRVDALIAQIEAGASFSPRVRKSKSDVYEKNKANWHLIGKRLSTTDGCTLCGKCAALCPSSNISIKDGRVVFGDGCTACLGCYHRCPQRAIRYMNKRKRDRYICPLVNESEIGK